MRYFIKSRKACSASGVQSKLEEGEPPLPKFGDEAPEGRHAAGETLHLLESSRGSHLLNGLDLLWVGLDPSAGDQETEELARRHPEDALFGVELQAGSAETIESHCKIFKQGGAVSGLDHEIVDVSCESRVMRMARWNDDSALRKSKGIET